MKRLSFLLIMATLSGITHAQQHDSDFHYQQAFTELKAMLSGDQPTSFKRAIYLTENAYFEGDLDYKAFNNEIRDLANVARYIEQYGQFDYKNTDSEKVRKYWAAFSIMKQSIPIQIDSITYQTTPYTYDFEDFFGEKDWTKMFVTKLLDTHEGNCHSLPFLYKILVEELGEKAWLSMSPNHTYIKQWTEETGWFNTELTSGQFPIDAWIMASGYIKLEAIQNRLYMDTLSTKESIAVVMTDLAQGYERKFGKHNNSEFVLTALDATLKYYPNYAHARILKAEALKSQYDQMMMEYGATYPVDIWHDEKAKALFDHMQEEYVSIYRLGYRQMPKKMYVNWLMDIDKQQTNKEVEKYTFTPPQPFKDYGYEVDVSTLTKGKYQEFFDLDTITPIGSVLLNRFSGKITGFIEYDTVYSEATLEPQVISRWLSPDPLSDVQQSYSPYNFVLNNPITLIDPTGLIWEDPNDAKKLKKSVQGVINSLAKRKSKLTAKIAKREASGKSTKNQESAISKIDGRTEQLETTKGNIDALGADQENTFRLASGDNQGGGKHGVTKGADGVINIFGSNDALHVHEIRHVGLSLASENGLEFNSNNSLRPTTPTGRVDEVGGYKAQYGFSGKGPGAANSDYGIVKNIANIKDSNNNYVYPAIRQFYLRREQGLRRSEKFHKKVKQGKNPKIKQ